MIIHAISDLHGYAPEMPGGDLLIIAGDCTARDTMTQWDAFCAYLGGLSYDTIVLVAGNHDGMLFHSRKTFPWPDNVVYLQDAMLMLDGITIYGMPWTPTYGDWHFMADYKEMEKHCAKIPPGIDILVTHGPACGILDYIPDAYDGHIRHAGCMALKHELLDHARPKTHIFGHVHECGGQSCISNGIDYYNVSCCDRNYECVRGHTEINGYRNA